MRGVAGRGCDVDDLSSGAAFDHAGDEPLAAVHYPHQVDRDLPLPVLGCGVEEAGQHPDAGVVDQEIHRVEPGVHSLGEFIHRLGVGDVDRLREHLGSQFAGGFSGFLQAGLVQIADGQSRAAARGQQGRRTAHAAAGAGDQHDAACQVLDVHS